MNPRANSTKLHPMGENRREIPSWIAWAASYVMIGGSCRSTKCRITVFQGSRNALESCKCLGTLKILFCDPHWLPMASEWSCNCRRVLDNYIFPFRGFCIRNSGTWLRLNARAIDRLALPSGSASIASFSSSSLSSKGSRRHPQFPSLLKT